MQATPEGLRSLHELRDRVADLGYMLLGFVLEALHADRPPRPTCYLSRGGRARSAQGVAANADTHRAQDQLAGTTRTDASRLLTQGSFGPVEGDISHVMEIGAAAWVDEQLANGAALEGELLNGANASLRIERLPAPLRGILYINGPTVKARPGGDS